MFDLPDPPEPDDDDDPPGLVIFVLNLLVRGGGGLVDWQWLMRVPIPWLVGNRKKGKVVPSQWVSPSLGALGVRSCILYPVYAARGADARSGSLFTMTVGPESLPLFSRLFSGFL